MGEGSVSFTHVGVLLLLLSRFKTMGTFFNPFKPEFLLLENGDEEENREQWLWNFNVHPLEGFLKQTVAPSLSPLSPPRHGNSDLTGPGWI